MRLRATLLSVLFAVCATAGAAVRAQPSQAPQPARPAPSLYDAPLFATLHDGRRLAFYCLGEGGPTVLLEAGAGNEASIWAKVQPALAARGRVCAYDRAGYGHSDLDRGPRDAEHVLADLREGLSAAGIDGPYLLVGHSLGSYFMRLFATRYRTEVVGMVLVDPMINGGHPPLMAAAPAYARYVTATEAGYERCLRPIARGEMQAGSPLYLSCGSPRTDPRRAEAGLLEQAGMQPSADEILAAQASLGDLPLVVLSRDPALDGAGAWPEADRTAYRRLWTEGHRTIAALSSRGVEQEVPGADHGIHQSRPEAVIAAVEAVWSAAAAPPAPALEMAGGEGGPVAM